MYTYIVDSSTKILYEALLRDGVVVDERYITGQNDHAKNIVITLEDMLKKEGITTKDLDKIICGVGPGSYTGVRMGVTVAKMLAVFMNKPLFKISTLALMSSGTQGKCLALIDARRGNSFSALYENGVLKEEELIRNTAEFKGKYNDALVVTETEFKVNPILVEKIALEVINPHGLEPNYLQETEAERNLNANKKA